MTRNEAREILEYHNKWQYEDSPAISSHRLIEAIDVALEALAEPSEDMSGVNNAYRERNHLVAWLSRLYPSGKAVTNIDGWDEKWHNCIYIDTPEGQVSWHIHEDEMDKFSSLPEYTKPWDGHSTEEKYRRVLNLTLRQHVSVISYEMADRHDFEKAFNEWNPSSPTESLKVSGQMYRVNQRTPFTAGWNARERLLSEPSDALKNKVADAIGEICTGNEAEQAEAAVRVIFE